MITRKNCPSTVHSRVCRREEHTESTEVSEITSERRLFLPKAVVVQKEILRLGITAHTSDDGSKKMSESWVKGHHVLETFAQVASDVLRPTL